MEDELDVLAREIEDASRTGAPASDDAASMEQVLKELDKIALSALSEKVTDPPKSSGSTLSKKVTKGPRRSYARSAHSLKRIRRLERTLSPPPQGATSGDNPSPSKKVTDTPELRALLGEDLSLDRYVPPLWDHAMLDLKATFYHRAIKQLGGSDFTLNLAPEIAEAARSHPKGASDFLHRRIKRALIAGLGHPTGFWFALDVTESDRRLHLHGGFAVNSNEAPEAKSALNHAAGKWLACHKEKQVLIADRLDDDWPLYALKHRAKVQRLLGRQAVLTVTNDVRRIAKTLYAEARRKVIDGDGTRSADR